MVSANVFGINDEEEIEGEEWNHSNNF
jgi:hypothetical protein